MDMDHPMEPRIQVFIQKEIHWLEGSILGSDYGLSSSVEQQYMFNRGQSGTTPKMSCFLLLQV